MSPDNYISYLSAFFAGVVVSLTPCVYPMLPIIVGYVGARSAKSLGRAFLLSSNYCLGVALVYTALGIFAALSGRIFGQVSSFPIVNILVGVVFIIFGLSIMGVFNLPTLNFIAPHAINYKPTGFGAFVLGATSALVMSPCTTPVMASILAYISSRKNILFGGSLMFVFALGMSMLFLLIGTFSSLVNILPKSAKWNEVVKKILGLVFIMIGFYFIYKGGRRWL